MEGIGYEMFVRSLTELRPGEEVEVEVRDCEQYRVKVVRAVLSKDASDLPDSEPVWIRALIGHLLAKEPWAIKIMAVLKEI